MGEWMAGHSGGGGEAGVPSSSRNHMAQPPPPPPQAVKIKGPHSGLALYSLIWAGFVLFNVGSGSWGTSLSRLGPSLAAH